MKNRYRVNGDEIIIYLDRVDGPQLETKVSIRHLKFLLAVTYKFFASWDKSAKSFYVVYHMTNIEGKDSIRSLHRLLKNPPEGTVVDHWDTDTLNNLDSNLNAVTQSQNAQNRNAIHPSNTTGLKGVSYCSRTGKYIAQIRANKKHVWLGRHDTPEEAHAVYMKYREQSKIYVNTEVI